MWQGVEYTAAPGGMEEAIKNYCKKETGEPLLFFPEKCTKIPAGLLSQEITGIFSMKKEGYRTFCVDFNTYEDRHYLASSVFYLFPKKIKGGQNELVKSPKMIAMTALIRVISF